MPARSAQIPERDEDLRDFRNFLYLVWMHLLGVPPTELQYDFAHYLQHGPDRLFLSAYRGFGKSWILAAYIVWQLYWDASRQELCVSASKTHADDISTFILQIIHTIPGLEFLSPEGRERHSKVAFDVGPAPAAKQPSVKSVGVTGQMTGSRGDDVLGDDVESMNNSLTQLNRERLGESIKEFDAIVKPKGRVIIIGTPQTEQSVYNLLPERGYTVRLWPIVYPDAALLEAQRNTLSPLIVDKLDRGLARAGEPTDPLRFSEKEIEIRRASYGRSGFRLQFQLDTSMADADRYPLKLRDLIVYPVGVDTAPGELVWSPHPQNELKDVPNYGMNGDRLFAPVLPANTQFYSYQGAVMFVDPAGTGSDETGYAVVKQLHGRLFVPECSGFEGGYSDGVLTALAQRAKFHKVGLVVVESNFGDGMFTKLLIPFMKRIHPCAVEEVRHQSQKERRIIEALEPVMNQHRLVVDPAVFERDAYRNATLPAEKAPRYLLAYQMTRLTGERGSLAHDDRLDALAGAVAYWTAAMAKDTAVDHRASREAAFDATLRDFYKSTVGSGGRPGMRGPPGWNGAEQGTWISHNYATGR
jgi:hypothetical protein